MSGHGSAVVQIKLYFSLQSLQERGVSKISTWA